MTDLPFCPACLCMPDPSATMTVCENYSMNLHGLLNILFLLPVLEYSIRSYFVGDIAGGGGGLGFCFVHFCTPQHLFVVCCFWCVCGTLHFVHTCMTRARTHTRHFAARARSVSVRYYSFNISLCHCSSSINGDDVISIYSLGHFAHFPLIFSS